MKTIQALSSHEQNMFWHCERRPALMLLLICLWLVMQFQWITTAIASFLFIIGFGY